MPLEMRPPPAAPAPQANVLSCPGCGAPLGAPRGGGQVCCPNCGRTANVRRPVPAPPRPAPVARDSAVPAFVWIGLAAVFLVVLTALGVAVFAVYRMPARRSAPAPAPAPPGAKPEPAISVAQLDQLAMNRTQPQVIAWAGRATDWHSDSRIQVKLEDSRFEWLALSWPDPNANHIEAVTFMARAPIPAGDPMLQAAGTVFGRRFGKEPSGSGYTYDSNRAHFSIRGRLLEIRASASDGCNWQRRIDALWQVARAIVIGRPVTLDADSRRDWLGTGYPIQTLASIDPRVDVDGSRAHMLKLFPGASWSARATELTFTVPLTHPWFDEAQVAWTNAKRGRLSSASLDPPSRQNTFSNQIEIRDCLAKRLGRPEDRETDHLAGEHSYFWGKHWPRACVHVHKTSVWLRLRDSSGVGSTSVAGVMGALAACGPGGQ